ncbi:hypothetical protein C0Q70_16834 [Pomacea canaliculata]|uniref:Tubulin--tyrosine ligase-like protein 9 n=1 Tax=Pomacea canaliculata TaxID=400727 RepID=A0A2T7NQY5_POMCA|nr:hypothetical protein C0Q70_16834 [Pomacea canaliculata]
MWKSENRYRPRRQLYVLGKLVRNRTVNEETSLTGVNADGPGCGGEIKQNMRLPFPARSQRGGWYHLLESGNRQLLKPRMRSPSKMMYLSLFILVTGVTLCALNIYQLHRIKEDHMFHHAAGPIVEGSNDENKQKSEKPIAWVAGSGYITNKVSLATSTMKFIPRAFKLPEDRDKFLSFSQDHPEVMWVQKSNTHRGIQIRNTSDLDLKKEGSFIQEYVSKPFLIDKHKFDIGVYTILTSINPLRVYIVEGDILFRFCPQEYYPFDPQNRDKYVVGDDYLPMWKVSSLKDIHQRHGFSFKDTFNIYMKSKGLDYEKVWRDIRSAIATVYLEKESKLIESALAYLDTNNFFEMVRFDFVLDEALNVFLMEANMSPNLSSSHFPPNKRLYEHVIFNVLGLIGLTHWMSSKQVNYEDEMRVSSADVNVFPEVCTNSTCASSCMDILCRLCKHCRTHSVEKTLKIAYLEHVQQGSCRRIFPPALNRSEVLAWNPKSSWPGTEELTESNKLMYLWFLGMCHKDLSWC